MKPEKHAEEYLGIAIEFSEIKSVWFTLVEEKILLASYACVQSEIPFLNYERALNRPCLIDYLGKLKSLLSLVVGPKPPDHICVSFPGLFTTTRFANIPSVSRQEFNNLLTSDAQIYCDPDKFVLAGKNTSGQRIPRTEDGSTAGRTVALIMADRDLIHEYREILPQAGFKSPDFSVDFLASAKAFESFLKIAVNNGESIGIIHIGKQTTDALVINSGRLIYTMSWGNDQKDDQGATTAFQAKRSYEYYLEQSGEEKLSCVFLAGIPAYSASLRDKVSEALGVPVKLGDPLMNMNISAIAKPDITNCAQRFVVPIGLGLIGIHARQLRSDNKPIV